MDKILGRQLPQSMTNQALKPYRDHDSRSRSRSRSRNQKRDHSKRAKGKTSRRSSSSHSSDQSSGHKSSKASKKGNSGSSDHDKDRESREQKNKRRSTRCVYDRFSFSFSFSCFAVAQVGFVERLLAVAVSSTPRPYQLIRFRDGCLRWPERATSENLRHVNAARTLEVCWANDNGPWLYLSANWKVLALTFPSAFLYKCITFFCSWYDVIRRTHFPMISNLSILFENFSYTSQKNESQLLRLWIIPFLMTLDAETKNKQRALLITPPLCCCC